MLPESETGLARHSGASRRDIALTGTTEHARLAVTGDGHGPDPSDASGSGLHGRAERLTAAGGRLGRGRSRRADSARPASFLSRS
ncbi:hypothetical protein CGZ69_10340 [Streptomyces peucetius subsp. caesius ATCC 27952]|nr:hypothetical protein CGZ69_10340 [Streptomyces peucetius subsp. caesius ATCC 27952]